MEVSETTLNWREDKGLRFWEFATKVMMASEVHRELA